MAFEASYGPSDKQSKRLYVSTASGRLFQVLYAERRLECVYQLHSGPIRSISVNEGFCATGSDDGFLRLWPLDFADFYLQAQHKAPVCGLSIAKGGLVILVVTGNGTMGVLDISTSGYKTLLRSHTGLVRGLSVDSRPEITTASEDGTLRVWDIHSLEQKYEFLVPDDVVTCVATSPDQRKHMIVAGFESGCVRVLDVESTSLFIDFQQHQGPVRNVVYSPDGLYLYSSGDDFTVCCYDVRDGYRPVRVFQCYHDNLLPPQLTELSADPSTASMSSFGTRDLPTTQQRAFYSDGATPARISKVAWVANEGKRDARERERVEKEKAAREKERLDKLAKPAKATHSLAVSADGSLIARIGASPDTCVVISTQDMSEAKRFRSCGARITGIRFVCPSNTLAQSPGELVLVLHDESVQRFDLSTGRLLSEAGMNNPLPALGPLLTAKRAPVQCVAASASLDGKLLATASTSCAVKLASRIPQARNSRSNQGPLALLSGTAYSSAWHHDAQSFVGHWSNTASWPESLEFTPDGKYLISACGTAIFVWEVHGAKPSSAPAAAEPPQEELEDIEKFVSDAMEPAV
jgi:WD40 repeat protein